MDRCCTTIRWLNTHGGKMSVFFESKAIVLVEFLTMEYLTQTEVVANDDLLVFYHTPCHVDLA